MALRQRSQVFFFCQQLDVLEQVSLNLEGLYPGNSPQGRLFPLPECLWGRDPQTMREAVPGACPKCGATGPKRESHQEHAVRVVL
jgi:hypothetical protein